MVYNMIYKELADILIKEIEALKEMLALLDEQYSYIMEKNIFKLEAMVDRLKLAKKKVAEMEVDRRKIIGNKSMKQVVSESKYESLISAYKEINNVIESIKLQKETNELLLRQQMSFNNQIINYINPRREMKTYNSYGNLSK